MVVKIDAKDSPLIQRIIHLDLRHFYHYGPCLFLPDLRLSLPFVKPGMPQILYPF